MLKQAFEKFGGLLIKKAKAAVPIILKRNLATLIRRISKSFTSSHVPG